MSKRIRSLDSKELNFKILVDLELLRNNIISSNIKCGCEGSDDGEHECLLIIKLDNYLINKSLPKKHLLLIEQMYKILLERI